MKFEIIFKIVKILTFMTFKLSCFKQLFSYESDIDLLFCEALQLNQLFSEVLQNKIIFGNINYDRLVFQHRPRRHIH